MSEPKGTDILARNGFQQNSADVRATQAFRFPRGAGAPMVGLGPSAPAMPKPSSLSPLARTLFPPWTTKLGAVSRDFSVKNFNLALGAAVGAQVLLPGFTLPDANVGWLQQFSIYLRGSIATSDVRYTLRFNQAPVTGWGDERNPPGIANIVVIDNNDLQVPIPEGATVDVLIENIGGGALTVGAKVGGWFHPLQAELDFWGPAR